MTENQFKIDSIDKSTRITAVCTHFFKRKMTAVQR